MYHMVVDHPISYQPVTKILVGNIMNIEAKVIPVRLRSYQSG